MMSGKFADTWLITSVGWSLLHFIWQGALVAACLAVSNRALRQHSANVRYAASMLAMLMLVLLPCFTFARLTVEFSTQGSNGREQSSQAFVKSAREMSSPTRRFENYDPNASAEALNDEPFALPEQWQRRIHLYIQRALPFLVGGWLLGVCFLLLRFCGGLWLTHIYTRRGATPTTDFWQRQLDELARRVRVSRPVRLCESVLIEVPTVIGALRPVILVPPSAFLGLTPQQLEAILLHELIHIRRYDYLVNLAQTIVEILFFYHPAVWWISASIRREREHACDDASVAFCGDVIFYATALVDLEQLRRPSNFNLPSPTVAALTKGDTLMSRIQRLLMPQTHPSRMSSSILSTVVASLFLLMLGVGIYALHGNSAPVNAQNKTTMTNDANTSNRQVAVGFVALPALNNPRPENEPPLETMQLIIARLTERHIPAIGFVQGKRLEWGERQRRLDMLRRWRDAGLELGIGSYSHKWFYDTPYDEYETDVVKNEEIVRSLLAERGQKIRYYSYPYLNTGRDVATKERFEQFLQKRNYKFVPYTIDNDDWFFAKMYDEARTKGNTEAMQKIKAEYVPYMRRMFEFDEQLSRELFGREIPQVLLLTPSRLNVDSFDELVSMIQTRGYKFITMDRATNDEAFKSKDTYTGHTGISWLQRWAITRGGTWRDEPRPAGYMEQFDYHKGAENLKSKIK